MAIYFFDYYLLLKFKLSAQLFTVWLMNIRSGLVNMKNISIIKDFFTDEREREREIVRV